MHSKGTIAAAPVTEFVVQLNSRQIWENVLKPDMNAGRGVEEREKECALPWKSC